MKLIKFDLPLNEKKIRNIEELRENVTIELLAHLKSGLLRKWLKSRELSDYVVKIEAIVIKEDSKTFYELCSVLDIAIALNDATTMIRQANLAQQQAQVESAKQIDAKLKEEQRLNELQEVKQQQEKNEVQAKVFEYRTDRFIVRSDGTASDTATGLMWCRYAIGQQWHNEKIVGVVIGNASKMDWDSALKMPDFFNQQDACGGFSDWRLPTHEELKSIVKTDKKPTIDNTVFPNTPREKFWCSYAGGDSRNMTAWTLCFSSGKNDYTSRNHNCAVRLVR